ncbi:MAG: ComEC/Rec2 family competence protein [Candidatus Neomarinimicrobiota bacterium]
MSIDFAKAPALRYLLYFCLGLILSSFWDISLFILAILLVLDLILIAIFHQRAMANYLFILCIILTAILRFSLANELYNEKLQLSFEGEEKVLTVLSQKSDPYYIKSYTVEVDKLKGTLYARKDMPILIPGKSYRVSSMDCRAIEPPVNPYVFNYQKYARSKGISHSFRVKKRTSFEDLGVKDKLRYKAFNIRTDISTRYLSCLGIEKGSLVNGLLLGLKSEIPENLASLFKKMGISHLLAVSGLHVGLIMMIIYQLLQVFSIPRIPRCLMIIAFLIFYSILTGGSASVVRSSLMSSMLLLAPLLKRRYNGMNAVATTAVILLLINPFFLNDVGFQFSFSAVFGILIAYPKFRALISMKNKPVLIVYIWDMLAVSFSAAMFTAPIAMFYFNSLQVASMALNCLVIPLTSLVMISAIICLPCLYLPSFISDIFLHALDLSLECFRAVLRLAARSGIWTLQVSSYWKAIYLGVFVIILLWIIFENKKRKIILTFVSVLSFSLMFFVQSRPEFIILALERGKCAIYRKGQEALLINTGAVKFGSNDLDRTIQPILEHFGINSVDVIITENIKQKTGNISRVKREYSDCLIYFPGPLSETERKYEIVEKDSSIVFAGDSIKLVYKDKKLDVLMSFAARPLYLKNEVSDPLAEIPIDELRSKALHYRFFGIIRQEID